MTNADIELHQLPAFLLSVAEDPSELVDRPRDAIER
jgi:hypothetical protein